MTYRLHAHSRVQARDASGAVAGAALLYFYQAGTETELTVYQEYDGTPHTNPVEADGNGYFAPIFVSDTTYKTVLKTSGGTVIETIDNIINSDAGTVRTVATGGTGGATAIAALDNLFTQGSNIAADTTVNLASATGFFVNVTGSGATVTSFGTESAGALRLIKYAGANTLTYNATSLILQGATNRTTEANDIQFLVSLGSGNWQEAFYWPVVGGVSDVSGLARTDGGFIVGNGSAFVLETGATARASMGVAYDIEIACSDETSALTTGTAKKTFRAPRGFTLNAGSSGVRASVNTAPTDATIIVDINVTGTGSILSTKLTIDATEKTSTTAAVPPVISSATIADDAEITIDIDQVGSTIAGAGLKVILRGTY